MKSPKRVVIIGGTHGNEWTGIQVVRHYQESLQKKFPTLKLEFILANPEAYKINKRFKDEDLNRAFQYLKENRQSYEHHRAHEIKQLIDKAPCLVIDLHTTTSNMGKTVIVSHYNPQNLHLCAHLAKRFDDCRIIGSPDPHQKYLASQSENSLMIEVGPVANGVVDAAALEGTLLLLEFILEIANSPDMAMESELEIFEEAQDVYYPKNEHGEITGYIHSEFQGQDFQVKKGQFFPFKTFSGSKIEMEIEQEMYPIFINEAAYYPQQLAFTLCQKKVLKF